jgi:predicted transcriptional regulator
VWSKKKVKGKGKGINFPKLGMAQKEIITIYRMH